MWLKPANVVLPPSTRVRLAGALRAEYEARREPLHAGLDVREWRVKAAPLVQGAAVVAVESAPKLTPRSPSEPASQDATHPGSALSRSSLADYDEQDPTRDRGGRVEVNAELGYTLEVCVGSPRSLGTLQSWGLSGMAMFTTEGVPLSQCVAAF